MKNLTLSVSLGFSESIINDDDIQIVMRNVMSALLNHADTSGLSPDDADWFTTKIRISEPYCATNIECNLI
jgi:hypothetical protein